MSDNSLSKTEVRIIWHLHAPISIAYHIGISIVYISIQTKEIYSPNKFFLAALGSLHRITNCLLWSCHHTPFRTWTQLRFIYPALPSFRTIYLEWRFPPFKMCVSTFKADVHKCKFFFFFHSNQSFLTIITLTYIPRVIDKQKQNYLN